MLVRDDAVDVRHGDDLVRRDQPHLAVVCGADRVVVGPLVTSRAAARACAAWTCTAATATPAGRTSPRSW